MDHLEESEFVLLHHDGVALPHWDFMVRDADALLTWRLLRDPLIHEVDIPAEPLGPHRLAYLSYEGPLSGGRGRVRRLDAGSCLWLRRELGEWGWELGGQVLRGRRAIRRTQPDQGRGAWIFTAF